MAQPGTQKRTCSPPLASAICGKDALLQGLKDLGLPKEAGHANEQVLVEGHDLGGVVA